MNPALVPGALVANPNLGALGEGLPIETLEVIAVDSSWERRMPGDFNRGYDGRVLIDGVGWVPAYLAGEVVS